MLEQRIEDDIKAALLARDSIKVTTLRGLKATLLNVKVAEGKRDSGLNDDEVIKVLSKEAKKRQESADLYKQGGNNEKAQAELTEKALIETYLPEQLGEDDINKIIDEVLAGMNEVGPKDMGPIIGQVKAKAGASADGAIIARLVREKIA
jgi:uncharacterized protein YqeY